MAKTIRNLIYFAVASTALGLAGYAFGLSLGLTLYIIVLGCLPLCLIGVLRFSYKLDTAMGFGDGWSFYAPPVTPDKDDD